MSTSATEPREDVATSDGDLPDDLWHLPADDLHDFRASVGLSWLTACGQMRPPARESKSPFNETADDCLVCHEMGGA